ncbi:MAG: hypothetical protein LBL65_05190 [Campylobacteraceae bacterium]|nr:hypothetical protein [Campylobacteraceae bacterium]
MKKVIFLVFMFAAYVFSEELYIKNSDAQSGIYMQTAIGFTDKSDKIIGKTQSVKELMGERKNINEFDLGFYARNDAMGVKFYGSLWFGNTDQYGVGYGIEGKYRPFQSIPISLVLGFDEKFGIGDDVFEERNVTISAINAGNSAMIYFTDDTRFDSIALKFGVEFDISKHFTLNVAYMPKWDRYKIKYRETGSPIFWREHETLWHEFHSVVQAGFSIYF